MSDWYPFKGMQTLMLQSTAFETLAGGARGPGKTDGGVVWLLKPYLLQNPRARSLVIRKNSEDLADWLDRMRYMSKRYGGEVTGQPSVVKFPSGYTIRTGHLKDDQAYTKYQGQEFQRMLIEELTQIATEKRYLQLISSCRSTVEGVDPRVMATTNPGGAGHGWVKKRFVDPSPWGTKFIAQDTGRTRVFFPGNVEDNPVLMEKDPDYVKFLDGLKSTDEELWKAWRLGDWNTFAGQFFKQFRRDLHTAKPFIPKKGLMLTGGLDWGRTNPFSFHLAVVERVDYETPFHRTWTFFERYGTDKTPREWSDEIEEGLSFFDIKIRDIGRVECDPAIFTKGNDNSISIADQFIQANEDWRTVLKRGSNDRIGGWENMHNWLSIAPDGLPYWIITENCTELIRTLPELVHDENKVEDVQTDSEDHAEDDQRYMLKALKWIDAKSGGITRGSKPKVKPSAKMIDDKQVSVNTDKFATDRIK